MTASIVAKEVGVRFLFDRQHRVMTPTVARIRRKGAEVWGLRGVTFSAQEGDSVALVGASGSGKTTLLRAIAGVVTADTGSLDVRGRIASLLSVQAGLLSVLTGRENAEVLGVLAGLSRREARDAVGAIHERSELGDAFDHPVSSYSEGMRARLAFAVGEQASPQILLLDEVHESLDHEFRARVVERARAIASNGGIVVAAGHDHDVLGRLCERGLLLRDGVVADDGDFDSVVRTYLGGNGGPRAS